MTGQAEASHRCQSKKEMATSSGLARSSLRRMRRTTGLNQVGLLMASGSRSLHRQAVQSRPASRCRRSGLQGVTDSPAPCRTPDVSAAAPNLAGQVLNHRLIRGRPSRRRSRRRQQPLPSACRVTVTRCRRRWRTPRPVRRRRSKDQGSCPGQLDQPGLAPGINGSIGVRSSCPAPGPPPRTEAASREGYAPGWPEEGSVVS